MKYARIRLSPSPLPPATAPNGMAMALLSVGFFTISILAVKAIHLRYGTSIWLITLPRFAVGLALAWLLFRGHSAIRWSQLAFSPWMIIRGALGGSGVLLYNWCVIEIGPSRVAVLTSSYPIFAALLAPLFLPERLQAKALLFSGIALIGIAMIVGAERTDAGSASAALASIAVALCSGLVVVAIRKLHATSNTATIFAAQCVYGLAFTLPGTFAELGPAQAAELALIVASAISVALGQICLTHSFRTLSVAKGSCLQLLGPPAVAIGAFGLFGEQLSLGEWIGAGIVLAACYRIARGLE